MRSFTNEYPHKFQYTGPVSSVPPFGIMAAESTGALMDAGGKIAGFYTKRPAGRNEALFVNSGSRIEKDKDGNCRSIFSGPFFVAYDEGNEPDPGDLVEIVEDEHYVAPSGGGRFQVLYVNTTLLVCNVQLIDGSRLRYAELLEDLAVATNAKTNPSTAQAKFLVRNSAGNLVDGETFTLTNRSTDFAADSGAHPIIVASVEGEWHTIAADCP